MEKHHQASYKALEIVDELCKKYDIKYFLMTGTALGAIRHKGFIPWDDDIDVGMTWVNYTKFLKILKNSQKELPANFFWSHPETNLFHPRFFGQLLYDGQQALDVIPIVKTSNNLFLRKLHWIHLRILYIAYLNKIKENPNIQPKSMLVDFCKNIFVF